MTGAGGGTDTEARSARLLFAPELAERTLTPGEIERPEVRAAVVDRRVPSRLVRELQRLSVRRGRLTWEGESLAPLAQARRTVLGDRATGARLLVRVDEYPHVLADDDPQRCGTDAFRRFHAVLAEAGVPYLLAVLPRVSRAPYDPDGTEARDLDDAEAAVLSSLRRDGVEFALHGLDHRTRHRRPSRHSELVGLRRRALEERLDLGLQILRDRAIHPRAFVPPFNRFAWHQYPALAARFDVVCGGPESVRLMGFHRTPLWRGDAVYAPAHPPLYGTAAEILERLDAIEAAAAGAWCPVVLHWSWEARDDFASLRRLAGRITGAAVGWDGFLDAVDASR